MRRSAELRSRPRRGRAAFAFIFVTVLLDMLALGIIIPVLPQLVVDFVGGDTPRAAEMLGMFGTAWALMQFLFSPVLGALSDRFGRRPVILMSNFGLGLDYILMALAPSLWWLFVGRVISGITAASISTAYAYIADVTPPEQRAANFGMLGVAFGAGFIIGPALGGLPARSIRGCRSGSRRRSSLANALYGCLILPESLPRGVALPFTWRRANPLGALKLLRSHRELFGLASVNFLDSLAHAVLPTMSVLYMLLPLRLGRAHGRLRDGGRRRLLDDGAGRADRPGGQALRRAQGADRGPCVRRRRICRLRPRADRLIFLLGVPLMALWGLANAAVARPDEPPRRRRRAGPAAGRQPEPAGHRQHDRPRPVHAVVCAARSGRSWAFEPCPATPFCSRRLLRGAALHVPAIRLSDQITRAA